MANTTLAIPETLPVWTETVNAPGFPARVMLYAEPTLPGTTLTPDTVAEAFQKLREPMRRTCCTSRASS